MNDNLFKVVIALIPVIGAIITGFVVPYIRQRIGTERLSQIQVWLKKAVQAAEVLFPESGCGEKSENM